MKRAVLVLLFIGALAFGGIIMVGYDSSAQALAAVYESELFSDIEHRLIGQQPQIEETLLGTMYVFDFVPDCRGHECDSDRKHRGIAVFVVAGCGDLVVAEKQIYDGDDLVEVIDYASRSGGCSCCR